ncbi:hypothetical protein HELRODRAFT_169448 [Helobdella robusta]|uniref:BMERB domain-containing protein n=1 Tax=Helobdella robusta TaxID=6412 RepID=T1F1Y1_HELRO|nr:hypothetical protein HELRODRAFT_169448 [Helobdella robusta]ESO08573.1 hypothetical protein HELRODRAFT_169448 [Helobdella robusta]
MCNEDQITMVVIQHYMDCKESEVMKEVMEELSEEGTQPIGPDGEAMHLVMSIIDMKHDRLIREQKTLVECIKDRDAWQEELYYDELRRLKCDEDKVKMQFNEMLLRTSNHDELKKSKEAKRGESMKKKNYKALNDDYDRLNITVS